MESCEGFSIQEFWMSRALATRIAGVVALLMITGCAAGTLTPVSPAASVESQAAKYCTDNGGVVRERYPAYGTNNLATALRLAGTTQFCMFTSASDGSRIHIALDTLYTTEPTLAVLAYLSKPPVPEAKSGVNPASVYCSSLGGSDSFGGVNASGGGWVTSNKDDIDQVLQACVFPDLSIIDSWGLTYHSNGTIRGTDLSKVVRYRPTETPKLYTNDR
jgi:putative hemolysin